MRPEMIGVTMAVKDFEVAGLSDADQDAYQHHVLWGPDGCADRLGRFVGAVRPLSELVASVTGPHNDPIQGMIHAHTVAGKFDLDTLPTDSDAYRVHVLEAEGVTEGNRLDGGLNRD